MIRDPIDDLMDHPAPLPDDGFTERVMAALPPPRPASRPLDRWLPPLVAGAVGAALAPDLAGLGGGLAATALRAAQGAFQLLAPAAGGGPPAALGLVAGLGFGLAVIAAVAGSRLVAARS